MRYLFLFIAVLFIAPAFAQSYYGGLPENKVTVNYPDHTVTTYVLPVISTELADDDKVYYWFRANTINQTQGGYSGKLLDGPYSDYFLNKNLKEYGTFNKGLKHGEWKSWWEDGKLKEKISWKKGLSSGRFYRYSPNGKLAEDGRFSRGLLSGRLTKWNGDSATVSKYKKGVLLIKKQTRLARFVERTRKLLLHKIRRKKIESQEFFTNFFTAV